MKSTGKRRMSIRTLLAGGLLFVLLFCAMPTALAASGSGSIYSMNGDEDRGTESISKTLEMNFVTGTTPNWSISKYNGVLGGFACTTDGTIDGATFEAGTLNKFIRTSKTLTDASATDIKTLALSATTFNSGSGTTTFENLTLNLSGASVLAASASGGKMVFTNCTINLTDASHLDTVAGATMELNNCIVNYQDAASYITSAGTLSFSGTTLDGAPGGTAVNRNLAAVKITAGICEVGSTTSGSDCTIQNLTNTSTTYTGGGAFNVTGGTLNLNAGTITGCQATSNSNNIAGGAAVYMDGGTANLVGMDISACGYSDKGHKGENANGPINVRGTGVFNMTGGSIKNCGSSHGAAISINASGAKANLSGGEISGNTAYYDGGAVFNYNGTLNVSGDIVIKDNVSGRNGSAIGTRTGAVVNISGSPQITGNQCIYENRSGPATIGAISGYNSSDHGTVTISGSPNISGNYYGADATDTSKKADLAVYDTISLSIGNMEANANVGICALDGLIGTLMQDTQQFATYTGFTDNFSVFFNDNNPVEGKTLIGSAGTAPAVVWNAKAYVCKIVDPDDPTKATPYTSLQEAIDAVAANGTATIQMLVESYNMTAVHTIAGGKNITITTAQTNAEGCVDNYPYPADATSPATLKSAGNAGFDALLSVASGATLNVDNLTLDGAATKANSLTVHGINCDAGGTLNVTNATIQNFYDKGGGAGKGGAGIYTKGTTTLGSGAVIKNCSVGSTTAWSGGGGIMVAGGTCNLQSDAKITECSAWDGGGVAGCGTSVINLKDDASITGNYAGNPAGGIYLYNEKDGGGIGGCTLNMSGGSITNNFSNNYGGGGVLIHRGSAMNLTGGRITGNGVRSSLSGGGIYLYHSGGTLNVSGNPVVTDNTTGATWNSTTHTVTVGGTVNNAQVVKNINVVGDLTTGAEIGVTFNGQMNSGNQFGVTTNDPSMAYSGLEHFTNDRYNHNASDTDDLFGTAGTGTKVIWGPKMTTQIIRTVNGTATLIGHYKTLAEACAAAQAGDIIQVYKSHELTTTANLSVANVTITTAPTVGTGLPAGAKTYTPATGESATTATVTRDSSLKAGMVNITGAGGTFDDLIFDGASVADTTDSAITVAAATTFADLTVQNCVSPNGKAAVDVGTTADAIELTLDKAVVITGNKNTGGSPANVRLNYEGSTDGDDPQNGGIIKINSTFKGTTSAVGVTVANTTQHASYHRFARAYDSSGTASSTVAAAAVAAFYDDLTPGLTIRSQRATGETGQEYDKTYLYFSPPTQFNFYKTTGTADPQPVAGAQFHIYQWQGTGTPGTGFLTDAELSASANWKKVPTTSGGSDYIFSSDADGKVDAGMLADADFRIVEIAAPDCDVPSGNWQMAVSSAAEDPGKFTFTTLKPTPDTNSTPDFKTTTTAAGEVRYTVTNAYQKGIVKVDMNVTGDYADTSRPFTVKVTDTPNGASGSTITAIVYNADGTKATEAVTFERTGTETKTFSLSHGQYLILYGVPIGEGLTVKEEDSDVGVAPDASKTYTGKIKNTPPTGETNATTFTINDAAISAATPDGGLAAGQSTLTITNTRGTVAPTGFKDGETPWLILLIIALTGLTAMGVYRKKKQRQEKA